MFLRDRMRVSFRIIDDRNRRTPVTLSTHEPIAETVLDCWFCNLHDLRHMLDDFWTDFPPLATLKFLWLLNNGLRLFGIAILQISHLFGFHRIFREHDRAQRNVVFLGKREVAYIMCAAMDDTRAVIYHDKGCDPDGQVTCTKRIIDVSSRENAFDMLFKFIFLRCFESLHPLDERHHFFFMRRAFYQFLD